MTRIFISLRTLWQEFGTGVWIDSTNKFVDIFQFYSFIFWLLFTLRTMLICEFFSYLHLEAFHFIDKSYHLHVWLCDDFVTKNLWKLEIQVNKIKWMRVAPNFTTTFVFIFHHYPYSNVHFISYSYLYRS